MIFRTAKMIRLTAAALFCFTQMPGPSAAAPYLVKDINPGPAGSAESMKHVSAYPQPGALGGTVYFQATDGVNGRELWKSDGTGPGTVLVKDIWTGTGGVFQSKPDQFAAAGGYMFFAASSRIDPVTLNADYELWRTDGSGPGTVSLDVYAGTVSSSPSNLTAMGSNVYLSAWNAANGNELFRAGGGGASLVKDIVAGTDVSAPRDFAVGNVGADRLFFSAYDDSYDRELWMSDGTEGGTARLKDINPTADSGPSGFASFGGKVYFSADDGTNGRELWITDGTEGGTHLFKDIVPGVGSSNVTFITPAGGSFFFMVNAGVGYELWKSDGTEANTLKVADIEPRDPYYLGMNKLVSYDNRVWFAAYDAVNGCELWAADGAGAAMFMDLNPGYAGGVDGSYCPSDLTVAGGILYFSARHETEGSGRELWATNGTPSGTVVAAETPGWEVDGPEGLTIAGSNLFFLAKGLDTGRELWALPTGDVVARPATPTGPLFGETNVSHTYDSGGAFSLKGSAVEYRFDWGDGSPAVWQDAPSASHTWTVPGTYTVTVEARDKVLQILSMPLTIVAAMSDVEDVSPPAISGPGAGTAGVSMGYQIGSAVSSLGHQLEYFLSWGDGSDTGGYQDYTDPASLSHTWGSAGDYPVDVEVRCKTHTAVLATDGIVVSIGDPPAIEAIEGLNLTGVMDGEIGVALDLTVTAASSEGHTVEYSIDWGDGSSLDWTGIDPALDSAAVSHPWLQPGTYTLGVTARCQTDPAVTDSGTWLVNIVNPAPEIIDPAPTGPTGPVEIWRGSSAVFSSGGAVSTWGSDVEYSFDWGDGTPNSDWLTPGPGNTVSASHSWAITGSPYQVWVTARSKNDPLNAHATSGPLFISIIDPEVVNPPGIPGGQTFGATGTAYGYTSDLAVSTMGHTLEYQFDWGDGALSTWSTSRTATKSWAAPGDPYEVRSRGRCAAHTEVVSDWSVPLDVIMLGGAGGELFVCKSGCSYANIQDAVNAAADGNTINVDDGSYSGDVDFGGKGLTIRSLGGPGAATIAGTGTGPAVTVSPAAPSRTAVLEGFTVTAGAAAKGGGIYVNGSQAEISQCVVSGNSAVDGGGIYATASELTVTSSVISGNRASVDGGGIFLAGTHADIVNSTVAGNRADEYGGGLVNYTGSPMILNSVFWGNSAGMEGDQIDVDSGSLDVGWSDIETASPGLPWAGTGNIADDPKFVSPVAPASAPTTSGDYHLKAGSPCLDSGKSSGEPLLPLLDVDGEKRPQYNVYDMGADEGTAPGATILANGQAGNLTIQSSEELVVTISLDPGTYLGNGADFWVLVRTPFKPPGDWYHFVPPRLWLPGDTVTYRGSAMKLGTYKVLSRKLPPGKYSFYFGIDLEDNGQLDTRDLFYDSVTVTVK